jgi:membrane protease YdiL (CAAX protease family)
MGIAHYPLLAAVGCIGLAVCARRVNNRLVLAPLVGAAGGFTAQAVGIPIPAVIAVGAAFLAVCRSNRPTASAFPTSPNARFLIGAVAVGLLAGGISVWAVGLTNAATFVDLPGLAALDNDQLLRAGVVAASLANAAGEELLWRYSVLQVLVHSGVARSLALTLQAVSFGVAHLHGVPAGLLGVGLATVFGLAAGLLVTSSGRLWPALMAHSVADYLLLSHMVIEN